jgi:hypothetical protein
VVMGLLSNIAHGANAEMTPCNHFQLT